MHWLTIAYSMTAAACVTLAAVHLLVWFKQPERRAHLAFSMTAFSVAAIIPIELSMLRAQTTGQFGTAIRWLHVPVALLTFSLVWFVWLHFRTGRQWLAYAACGLRVLALILNFSFTPNLNYQEITSLRQVALFGGESVSTAVGVVNPWTLIGQLSILFLFLYMLDASFTLWRRGDLDDRRRAAIVGGSIVFFILTAGGYVALVLAGFILSPLFLSFPFLAIVAAMGYELSVDVVQAGQLSLEVKANERRLSLAQEAGDIGAFDWDMRSGELRWTERLESIYGLPPGGFGGPSQSWRELVHPEDLLRCEAEINAALGEKLGGWQTQYRIVRSGDGAIRWIDARGRFFFDEQARPVRMLGVNMDITGRKQAEEAKNNLAAIVESSNDAILSKTLDGTITSWNAGAEKMYGFSASEMVGKPVSTLIPVDLKDELPGILDRIKSGETVDQLETVRVTKDGRRIDVSLTISALKNEHGMIIGASTIAHDITHRKQALNDLRESEERFRMMADTAPVMVWVSGADTLCTFFNRSWLEFTGRTMAQELGNGWAEGVHPADYQRCLDTYLSAFNARRDFTMEYRLKRADGQYRWLLDKGVPRLLPNGDLAGYIGSCLDITERRRDEETLQKLTGRLLMLQDEERQRVAAELHDGLGQNLAIIKNRAMIGLRDQTNQDRITEQLEEIAATATSSILEVREIAHNLRPYELDRLGLGAAIESMIERVSETTTIKLSADLERIDGLLSSEAETSVYRMVQEGLNNVIRHSHATEARIAIRKSAKQLLISVHDNGTGIVPPAPADKDNKRMGFGLAGIAERVRVLGGSLAIDSQPSHGTTLNIHLELTNGRPE